jgi:hypothetical protein
MAPWCAQRCRKTPVSPPASMQRPEGPFPWASLQTLPPPNQRRHRDLLRAARALSRWHGQGGDLPQRVREQPPGQMALGQ